MASSEAVKQTSAIANKDDSKRGNFSNPPTSQVPLPTPLPAPSSAPSAAPSAVASPPPPPTYAESYETLMFKHRNDLLRYGSAKLDISAIEQHFKQMNMVLSTGSTATGGNDSIRLAGPNSVRFIARRPLTGLANESDADRGKDDRIFSIKIILKDLLTLSGASVIKRSLDYERLHECDYIAPVAEFASIGAHYLSLATDYYPNGSVASLLSRCGSPLTEQAAGRIFSSALIGLAHLHTHKMCHRNLKLENILLDAQMRPRLADFSASIVLQDRAHFEGAYATALPYLAPEISSGIPYDPAAADIWAFGICLFIALNDMLPASVGGTSDRADPRSSSCTSQLAFQYRSPQLEATLSDAVKQCIKQCLHIDVNQRISNAVQLQNEIWFQK